MIYEKGIIFYFEACLFYGSTRLEEKEGNYISGAVDF
jgi:hypothetical protein